MTSTEKRIQTPSQPQIIKRNYHTRTYSGANLLRSAKLTPIQHEIQKSVQVLAWYPRNVATFPELKPLDRRTEMKIMDVVLGDDPLKEGLVVEDANKKRAQLAEKNLKEALGQAGNKRVQLQERHDLILLQTNLKLKDISKNSKSEMNSIIKNFVEQWEMNSKTVLETRNTLKGPKLRELSLKEYQLLKKTLNETLEAIQFEIRQLELDLELIEKERVVEMGKELTTCANQLKKLNFQRHDVIDELFEDEAYATNLTTIQNREKICDYLQCMKEMVNEMVMVAESCCEYTDEHWNQVRAAFLMSRFQQDLQNSVHFDFEGLYRSYQLKFDDLIGNVVSQIEEIVRWNPFTDIRKTALQWRQKASTESMEQQHVVDLFSDDLNKLERSMDAVLDGVSSRWFSQMKEVDREKLSLMKQDVSRARKTKEVMLGRQAEMCFGSKLARNNCVLSKIMEFVFCISVNRTILLEFSILEPEVEVATKLKEIRQHYNSIKADHDKALNNELHAIRLETKEATIYHRSRKAKEVLKAILDTNYEWYDASVKELKSIQTKVEDVHQHYKDNLVKFFEYNSSVAEGGNPLFHELMFWSKKVEEWCLERQAEKTKRLGEIDSKKKPQHQVKKQVKIVDKPAMKPVLLDGTSLPTHPDPMLMLIDLGVENYHVLGHFIELDQTKTTEVIEIQPIGAEVSHKARKRLEETLFKDTEDLLKIIRDRTTAKVHQYLEYLERERIKKLTDYEAKLVNIDEAVNFRIERLPQIHQQHQNEAKFIIDAIQDIRDGYHQRMTVVFKEIKDFQDSTIKETSKRLQSCNTVGEIIKLKDQFQILVDKFNFDTSEEIEKATLEFEHGRKMLGRSKLQGNHSSAWLILKDSGAIDSNSLNNAMDQFKQAINEEVSNIQKDVLLAIRIATKEFDHYQQDWDLLNFNKSRLRKLRTLLRAELIWCENKSHEFQAMVEALISKMESVQTWKDILGSIQEIDSVQCSAILFANYLGYPYSTEYNRTTKIKPSIEDWKSWKEDFVKKKEPILVSATTTPKTPRNGTPRSSKARKELVSRTGSGGGIKKANVSPLTTVSTTPQQAPLVKPVRIENAKGTTINPKENSRESSPDWDFKAPAPIDKRLSNLFTTWIDSCRRSLLERYEQYIPLVKEREIKLTKEIPSPSSAYIQMVDQQLQSFLSEAKEKQSEYIDCFSEKIHLLQEKLEQFVKRSYHMVLASNEDLLSQAWEQRISIFLDKRTTMGMSKKSCRQKLQASMGHPSKTEDLSQLHSKAESLTSEMTQYIIDLESTTKDKIEKLTIGFLSYLQFLTLMFTDLTNNQLQTTTASKIDGTLSVLSMLDYPFENVKSLCEDFTIRCNKEHENYEYITKTRDEVNQKYLALVKSKLEALHNFVKEEVQLEQEWKQEFLDRVQYIKQPYQ